MSQTMPDPLPSPDNPAVTLLPDDDPARTPDPSETPDAPDDPTDPPAGDGPLNSA